MFKNTATKIALFVFDSATGLGKSGDAANLTAYVSLDYGTVTVLGDTSATEMDATNAKGWYLFDVAQAESNADACLFTGKSTTANVSVVGQLVFTTPANFSSQSIDSNGRVDVIKVAGTTQTAKDIGAAVPAAAAGASGGLLISGSNAGTTTFGAFTITGSMTVSDGLLVSRSTSNASAITATGNGTGHGISAASGSGATGNAINAAAASTTGNGLNLAGAGGAHGLFATGGATGMGMKLVGGSSSGHGLQTSAPASGSGIYAGGAGVTNAGIVCYGSATTGAGLHLNGGSSTGDGLLIQTTSGHGINTTGTGSGNVGIRAAGSTNAAGMSLIGAGTGAGLLTTGGATGIGLSAVGGATSGDGIKVVTTVGHGINLAPVGTDKHGLFATGGNGGTSDGIKAVAGTGGVPIRGDITGNITGAVSGAVGSVTGAVGSVTAAVSITGDLSSTMKASVNAEVDTAIADAALATAAALATVDGIVDSIAATTEKLDDTLEDDAGTYRFTTNALEQAPTGGGGSGPTAAEIADEVETRTIAAVTLVNGLAANVITAAATAADFTTEIQAGLATAAALATVDDFLDTEIAAIKAKTDNLPSDPADASDVAAAVAAVKLYADRTVIRGTVSATAPTTTGFTASALSPAGAAVDQFKGRIIIFDNATTTVELRGQATDITANTIDALPTFTFNALTDAPQSGDTFSIV